MNVFHIDPRADFLKSLIEGTYRRFQGIDPSQITIFLPSKRACKHLLSSRRNMPRLIPMGEIKDNTMSVISPLEYKLLISQELRLCKGMSYRKAMMVASEIYDSIIKFNRDGVNIDSINEVDFSDLPIHSQELIEHLKFINRDLLKALSLEGRGSVICARNKGIYNMITRWQSKPPKFPVIIAGSIGSAKATAELLKATAKLANGFIILTGVDLNLSEDSWNQINELHPSFQLKCLLEQLKINRNDLQNWNPSEEIDTLRSRFLSEAMCPPSVMNWHQLDGEEFGDLKGIEYLECNSHQEEATIIIIKVKELLEKGCNNIGIIINDLDLKKRILATARLYDINIEDSYGASAFITAQINFISTIFEAIENSFSPVWLIDVLTNRFSHLKYQKERLRTLASQLNIKYLRGICAYNNLEKLIEKTASKQDLEISQMLQSLLSICEPAINMLQKKIVIFEDLLSELIVIAQKLSENPDGKVTFWEGKFSDEIKGFLNELSVLKIGSIPVSEFKFILNQCLANKRFTSDEFRQCSVQILSPIESRLLNFDYVILAGLNEKSWPEGVGTNSWFSALSKHVELTRPEARIGKSAHDFFCLMHSSQVMITRATTVNGDIQVPSRWLIRIEALTKKLNKLSQIKSCDHHLLKQARELFLPSEFTKYSPPAPKPPQNLRPISLSVTQIEKLIRDPYSVYVSKILNIKKLDKLEKMPDQLEFGNFIHQVIDELNKKYKNIKQHEVFDELISSGKQKLSSLMHNPIVQKMWWPRFEKIAKWIVGFEELKRANGKAKIYSEVKGSIGFMTSAGAFNLTAKADRIEVNENNIASIIDFKTGSIPSNQDIINMLSPQLSLEGLIASKGGFDITIESLDELAYIQFSVGNKLGAITNIKAPISELIKDTEEALLKLIELYADENTPYLICPNPKKAPTYNELEHLERLSEWQ